MGSATTTRAPSPSAACACDNPHCPSGGSDGRASQVTIHVVTEALALETPPDPLMNGRDREPEPPDASVKPPAGVLLSGGIVPTPLLAELIRSGATVREVQR